MSRPVYENKLSLASEAMLARVLAQCWAVIPRKLPIHYKVDWALFNGMAVVGWAELKIRKNPRAKYPEYMISAAKVLAGQQLEMATGLPFFLIVQWEDECAFIEPVRATKRLSWGGRTDRDDAADRETVYFIPVAEFIRIGAGNVCHGNLN